MWGDGFSCWGFERDMDDECEDYNCCWTKRCQLMEDAFTILGS